MADSPRQIIIDTDPGIDDAMAIFYALASPELDVIALTTVFGNSHTEITTTNALRLLEIANRTDIPVARGADRPLAMDYRGPADFVHGEDSQGNLHLPPPVTRLSHQRAAELIIDRVMSAPGQITLCPVGPLTNIALAMLMEPTLTDHVASIVLMGGAAFCGGNASPAAEANIINDPEAADIVFGASCPIVMAGLDVTEATFLTGEQIDLISTVDNPRAKHAAAILPLYREFNRSEAGQDGIYVHDSTVISYLLAPQHYRSVSMPIRVDCGSSVGRGKTWPAKHRHQRGAWAGRPDVTILTEVDADAVVRLEMSRLGLELA